MRSGSSRRKSAGTGFRFLAAGSLAGALLVCLACGGSSEASGGAGGRGGPGGPGGRAGRPAPEPILVEVEPVAVGEIASVYSSTGTLLAERQATAKTRIRGRVQRIFVEEGDEVEKGQILARLEDEELVIARDRARATEGNNKIKFERSKSLLERNLVSEEAYQEAMHSYEVAHNDAEMADLELSYATIRAPLGGTIARRHVSEGQEVATGDPLFDIVDQDPLLLELYVPERLVGRLAPGQTVDLTLDATGRSLPGVIARISPVVDTATGTVKVTVEIHDGEGVRTGSFARARVVIDLHDDARIVPRDALVSEGDDWFVYVVDEGKARKVAVRLGFEEADRVELLEGPDAGEAVVVTGAPALQEGAPVEVLEASSGEGDVEVPEISRGLPGGSSGIAGG